MAGHGNPGRIGGHEIQVSGVWQGGHASRCAENLGWNPERDSGLALRHREAREVAGSIRRKPTHGKLAVASCSQSGATRFPSETKLLRVCKYPLSRRLGAPRNRARAGRKKRVYLSLDAKMTIANLWFLEYAFLQKDSQL